MLASRISRIERRGIVLVLVLAMLGLLALIGVTFATFSSQAKINARNYAQSLIQPQADELIDYALSQLIGDTEDIRSAIRGHSLGRDMYGSDATQNGLLTGSPFTGPFYITGIAPVTSGPLAGTYQLTTNISASDATFYGYHFTRWIIRVSYTGALSQSVTVNTVSYTPVQPVTQTLEILNDNGFADASGQFRVFTVAILDSSTNLLNPSYPTGPSTSQLPAQYLVAAAGSNLGTAFPFVLDGRWLRAFNGPGATNNAVYGNFRYNGGFLNANNPPGSPGSPRNISMDEDYDACDLENWFLAIQSADGQMIIPSFHRPGIIRYDPTGATPVNDWQNINTSGIWADSAARILRPRSVDFHDAATFPDLVPSAATGGKINYDVDNDADGIRDSVWLDLGYPARRDPTGKLYKPLFSFMVIGLNGRIPLNTAGNLAGGAGGGGGALHAAHLGNSVSEVDPSYALQNANQGPSIDVDPFNTTGIYSFANSGSVFLGVPPSTMNTQVDNAISPSGSSLQPADVRLTQLRNILAGTRPQPNPTVGPSASNGDNNFVFGSWPGTSAGQPYYLPNGIADGTGSGATLTDTIFAYDTATPPNPYVFRGTPPVAGRWGEAPSIPGGNLAPTGTNSPPAVNGYVNLVRSAYQNSVRAGYSYDMNDVLNGILVNGIPLARDAADDDFNMFDPWPIGHQGELNDADMYDASGGLILPAERYRRFVTPADIDGTGIVSPWPAAGNATLAASHGADPFGRVLFTSYFRPPGAPGVISSNYSATPGQGGLVYVSSDNSTLGTIYYPTAPNNIFYTAGPVPPILGGGGAPYIPAAGNYLPDLSNNPLHGFESFKIPNSYLLAYPPPASPPLPSFSPSTQGGMVVDQPGGSPTPATTLAGIPTTYPTYDTNVHDDGLNDANELNLYNLNPLLDSPYGPNDLQWLYRQQDVDGASLSSRLAQLAPISFTNTIDGPRRRRLFSIDSWELNNFVWANDNPGNVFTNNSSFLVGQSASFANLSTNLKLTLSTPSLAQRDKKINLNYPLPVSNDPHEPVRQKWINDAYQLLKRVLPPRAVDTPEELAQIGQFVVNIIDFRDSDGTITIWTNPDLVLQVTSTSVVTPPGPGGNPPKLYFANNLPPTPPGVTFTNYSFVQYGMEYNPVAINETLAYAFSSTVSGAPSQVKRFFIELVNTLTQTAVNSYDLALPPVVGAVVVPDASTLDLGGFNNVKPLPSDPYAGGCWDLVFTGDDPASRPDPYRGDLFGAGTIVSSSTPNVSVANANLYGLIPLSMSSFSASAGLPTDVELVPLNSAGVPAPKPGAHAGAPPINFYYVIGNPLPASTETSPPSTAANSLTQTLSASCDPVGGTGSNPGITWYPGILPGATLSASGPGTAPPKYSAQIPALTLGKYQAQYYWVCLRRPANLFAPVSANNPMVVVDSMRFPYIDGTANPPPVASGSKSNFIYSTQRMQPFRGGHAVPVVTTPATAGATLDARYGYTEQIATPKTKSTNQGVYATSPAKTLATNFMYHTLGKGNDSSESWDYLPFNDRDFTSVAELMMVPGCPPGLFTKQFAEFAPGTYANTLGTPPSAPSGLFSSVAPQPMVPISGASTLPLPVLYTNASIPFNTIAAGTAPVPHTFPYLADKFFYTGASLPLTFPGGTTLGSDTGGTSVNTAASDGWFKMFDFFEVPTPMIGGIGPVAQGTNFDWARQDMKPGLLNLNLIADEEVFFSILGKHNNNLIQTLLNSIQIPSLAMANVAYTMPLLGAYPLPATAPPVPLVVSAVDANGSPSYVYPISNGSGSGITAPDPYLMLLFPQSGLPLVPPNVDSRLKAAFVQFLWLRHGGSGYLFGFGSGGVGQNNSIGPPVAPSAGYTGTGIPAERPFHSLSYPDINYTVMRPNTLPPSLFTNPQPNAVPSLTAVPPVFYTGDPGVRNANLYAGYVSTNPSAGFPNGGLGIPTGSSLTAPVTPVYPPAIPVRRLFQGPDFTGLASATGTVTAYISNAGDSGDPVINNQIPVEPATALSAPIPVAGGLPPYNITYSGSPAAVSFNNVVVTTAAAPFNMSSYPSLTMGGSVISGGVPIAAPSGFSSELDLGGLPTSKTNPGNPSGGFPAVTTTSVDNREHPFWRIEMMQRVMNQTTVRTHQYAVWLTVGFFEVTRQGDIGMVASATPWLAYDILGPEIGALNGKNVRYRGFYLVDRLQLTGFDPSSPGQFRAAVTYRQRIQ
jgi:large repetitive protein